MKNLTKGVIAIATVFTIAGVTAGALSTTKAEKPVSGSAEYTISISASSTNIEAGGTVIITTSLQETSPIVKAVSDAKISLLSAETKETIASGVTNSKGNFSISLSFPEAGTYAIYAQASSPEFITSDDPNGTLTSGILVIYVTTGISIPKIYLQLTVENESVYQDTYDTFTVRFIRDDPNPTGIPGATISLTETNTHSTATGKTNQNGEAVFKIKFPETGVYDFYASYSENGQEVIKSNLVTVAVEEIRPSPPPPFFPKENTEGTHLPSEDLPPDELR